MRDEAPLVGPTLDDGIMDAEACRQSIQMSIGPLVDRYGAYASSITRTAVGFLSTQYLGIGSIGYYFQDM